MKRLIGIFIFLLICVISPVYADNKGLVQYIGDSYTEDYSKDGMITGDVLWYVHASQMAGVYHNYYMVDGIVDQSVTGAIEYEGEYYKVDSGKIDTSYNGPWTCGKTTYYLVNGHTNKNME